MEYRISIPSAEISLFLANRSGQVGPGYLERFSRGILRIYYYAIRYIDSGTVCTAEINKDIYSMYDDYGDRFPSMQIADLQRAVILAANGICKRTGDFSHLVDWSTASMEFINDNLVVFSVSERK